MSHPLIFLCKFFIIFLKKSVPKEFYSFLKVIFLIKNVKIKDLQFPTVTLNLSCLLWFNFSVRKFCQWEYRFLFWFKLCSGLEFFFSQFFLFFIDLFFLLPSFDIYSIFCTSFFFVFYYYYYFYLRFAFDLITRLLNYQSFLQFNPIIYSMNFSFKGNLSIIIKVFLVVNHKIILIIPHVLKNILIPHLCIFLNSLNDKI